MNTHNAPTTGPADPTLIADLDRLREERQYWSGLSDEWANEATRRARWIYVAQVLAEAIRSHGPFMDEACKEALEFYDETWAEWFPAHNDGSPS